MSPCNSRRADCENLVVDDEARARKREYMKAWRAANKERVKENWKRWHEANKDNPEYKAKKRGWQVENRAKLSEQEKHRRRKFAAENPDEYRARKRAEYETNRESYRAYNKRYYAKTADEQKRKAREWQVRNRERRQAYLREWSARWREANPEKYREQTRRTNLRRRGDEIDLEYSSILLCDPCSYCGEAADTVDHIVPLFVGGTGVADNLTAACRSCNSGKRDRSLLAFMGGRLDEARQRTEGDRSRDQG